MNFSIVTDYPLWFVVFCIMTASLYTIVLYRKDTKFDKQEYGWKVKLMSVFRFISIFIISLLLLSPLIRSISKTIEKPLLVFVQDDSESILINKDSLFYKNEYPKKVTDFLENVEEKFDVVKYSFGENIENGATFEFNDKYTDFSKLINKLKNQYLNRNIGAYIIASDGIYNKGVNPVFAMSDVTTPVYSIALGDTGVQKDIMIAYVKSNKIAFLGNLFPVQVDVEINDLKGVETKLRVVHKGKNVFEKTLVAKSNRHHESIDIQIEANEVGIQHYRIEVNPVPNEVNIVNNRYDLAIDVIDSKQKILIVSNSPHPDIGAIHKTLEKNLNFEIEFATAAKFADINKLKKYNLIILHQLPSIKNSAVRIISALLKTDVPLLFIHGTQTDFAKFNSLKASLTIGHKKRAFDDSRAVYNEEFPLFELNKDIVTLIDDAPPLVAPFGNYHPSASSSILFYQKVKNIQTTRPLIMLDNFGDRKVAHITGEGIWRWRMYNYLENSNHQIFDELINKIVQYLSIRVTKDKFVVNAKKIFTENGAVVFQAEVYNESYELVTDADVRIVITNDEENKFEFNLEADKASTKTYLLDAGVFPVGGYSYTAYMKRDNKKATKSGKFMVMPVNEEAQKTIANHRMLYQLSIQNGGEMFYPAEISSLADKFNQNKDFVSVAYIEKSMEDVINLKLIFWLVILLLSVEWFMRKFFGSY